MSWATVFPVLTLVLGFFISEMKEYLKVRREDKRALGRALAILLDIRSDVFYGGTLGPDALMDGAQIPEQQRAQLRETVRALMPDSGQQRKRYEEAVSLISGALPLLGYDLTGYETMSETFERIKAFATEHPELEKGMSDFSAGLYTDTRRKFDKLIINVARAHGRRTAKETQLELLDKRD